MRRIVRWCCALALVAPAVSWAGSSVVSEKADDVEIVVYRFDAEPIDDSPIVFADEYEGLALISEERELDIPAGRSTLVFRRTAGTMVPQTARLLGLPGGVVEANFDYSLISWRTLVAASTGRSVRVVRTQKSTGKRSEDIAVIRSGPDGIVLEYPDHTEALSCSGLQESIIFDDIPPSLLAEPTLSVQVDVRQAGRYKLRLNYLATGLQWSADYVARLGADGHSMDLSGWLTLSNRQSTGFPHAVVKVVAGDLSVDAETRSQGTSPVRWTNDNCWPLAPEYFKARHVVEGSISPAPLMAQPAISMKQNMLEEVVVSAAKRAALSDLGDYKLYSLPERTDLSARQAKQVAFLDQHHVQFEKKYRYSIDLEQDDDRGGRMSGALVVLSMENSTRNGLGVPLPMGVAATFDTDAEGRAIFAGDGRLRDVAVDAPLELITAEALDVGGSTRIVSGKKIDHWWRAGTETETEVEVVVANTKAVSVRMDVELDQEAYEHLKVADESHPHGGRSHFLVWSYDLQPGQQEVLHLVLRQPE